LTKLLLKKKNMDAKEIRRHGEHLCREGKGMIFMFEVSGSLFFSTSGFRNFGYLILVEGVL